MYLLHIFLLLFFFVISGMCYALPTRGGDISISMTRDYSSSDSTGEWLTLAEYNIRDLSLTPGCIYLMCNGANQSLTTKVSYNNRPYVKSTFTNFASYNSPMRINTPDGDMFVRLTFSGVVTLSGYLENHENSRVWTKNELITNNTESVSIQLLPENPCGALLTGCTFTTFHGLSSGASAGIIGGSVKVEVKLPPAISRKTYTINNVALAKIETIFNKTNNITGANYTNSYFSLSATINIPERCYLNVNGLDDGVIKFNTLDASTVSDGSPLQSRQLLLESTCTGIVGANKPVISEVKLSPSGNTTLEGNYIFRLKPANKNSGDSMHSRYLGIVAKSLPHITNCDAGDGYTFTGNSYMNKKTVVPENNALNGEITSTSFVSFGLCLFGDGDALMMHGEHTGAIQLTTRWRFDSSS
ncbi:hypothetical protein IM201_004154 [Escherichia coli]|nr:hypothetical protein [Escherichia coli]EGJ4528555.1 hypothetical protein [Escherichia coli]EGJ4568223.1 hypothetical protein [Escherichia coli]EGJ4573956.1 hypothetical protein [Escherichia coli]EGJ4602183.1 hypothetical protein [Escherichia coli]